MRRSNKSICEVLDVDEVQNQINTLRNIPQPQQRTDEWYSYRHNMIAISNLLKVFGTECQYNSLIYENANLLNIKDEYRAPV